MGRDRRRVRFVDEPARHHLSPPARHSGRAGAPRSTCRPWCSAIWAKPRRPASPSRAIRRPARRSSTANFSSMRRARTWSPAFARRRRSPRKRARRRAPTSRRWKAAMPLAFAELKRIHAALEKHYRDMQDLEFTVEQGKLWMLQTRNGKRTAKAALRIAVELAQEKLISKEEAVTRVDPAVARPAAASDHRSRRRAQDHRHRPAGVARRGLRRDRVLLRGRGAPQEPGAQGHPGPRRDLARGHSRHARGRGHPHHPRRHDLACGRGGARHGQALRRRRRRAARRLPRADHDRRRRDDEERRYAHHRRLDRAGAGRQGGDARAGTGRRIRHADEVGRRGAQAQGARQCRYAGRRARRHQVRRRGHRAVPHRAYVLRRGPHPRGARDDPGRRREGAPRGARQAVCRCSAPISSSCS